MKTDLNRYEDPWTAEIYDYQSQGRGNDVPFWLALAQQAEGEVLELACGTGAGSPTACPRRGSHHGSGYLGSDARSGSPQTGAGTCRGGRASGASSRRHD